MAASKKTSGRTSGKTTAKKSGKASGRTEVTSNDKEISFDFELDEKQQAAVIDCIRKHGKVSIKLGSPSVSKLPGRGLLDNTEGKLID